MFKKSDWQKKYEALSDDFRTLEKSSTQAEKNHEEIAALLKLALRQTSQKLIGQSSTLDEHLLALINAAEAHDTRRLKKLTRQFDKLNRLSQDQQQQATQDLLDAMRRWVNELKILSQQDVHLTSLDLIKNQSSEAVSSFQDTSAIIVRLVGLQNKILNEFHESGLLNTPVVNQSDIDEDNILIMKSIAGDLLALMDGVHLAHQHREMAEQLIEDLEQSKDLSQLPKLMHRCVTLLTQYSRSITDDFENYLLETSQQLTEIQHYIVVNHEQAISEGEERLKRSTQMFNDVESLKQSAASASDLKQLKAAVQAQFSKVHQAVNELKTSEASRIKETKQQHQKLRDKLAKAEEHAQATMIKVEEERIRSRVDPLTELPNRTAYNERIALELDRVHNFRSNLCIAICDIDHFKKINDTYGHLAGDKVLQLLGIILRDFLPDSDFVARIGGEEFVVLIPNKPLDEAQEMMDKVRGAIAASPFNHRGTPVPVTISIGMTIAHGLDNNESLFERADQQLYAAKNNGRNRICASADSPETL
ncbi:MAG: GGDEF domain-containing protein [Pontibacterium sp.]